jgi:hypothetical protein
VKRRGWAVAGLAAALALWFWPVSAASKAPVSSGYWVKFGLTLATVPSHGLLVAGDPSSALSAASGLGAQLPVPVTVPTPPGIAEADLVGPTAVSAVQITGVSPTADATLTLTVALGSIVPPPGLATIVACPLSGDWQTPPAGAGDVSEAPGYDCASPSVGRVATNDETISWLLPSAFQTNPGELDVALVPNPNDSLIAFAVAFEPPGKGSVQAATGPPPAVVSVTTTVAPASTPTLAPSPAVPSGGGLVTGGSPAFATPGFVAPDVVTPVAATPVATPSVALAAPAQAAPSVPPVAVRVPDDRAHRIMAVVLLLVVGAAWWYAGSQESPAPRLLGALGDRRATPVAAVAAVDSDGGIGRFRRPRTSPARRL